MVKTLRRLGLRSAIAYHELDTRTPAVSIADLAIQVGGRTPITSYLAPGQIIAATDQARAGALLPAMGYFPKCGVRQSRDNRRRCVRHPCWRSDGTALIGQRSLDGIHDMESLTLTLRQVVA
ncbi:biotin carboxylase N-terminal domain-containing protein [Bradyrhizobium sp. USDA 4451]